MRRRPQQCTGGSQNTDPWEWAPRPTHAADLMVDHYRNTEHAPEPAQVMQLTRVVDAIDRVSVLIYRDYDCPTDQVRRQASVGLDTQHLQARLCSPLEHGNRRCQWRDRGHIAPRRGFHMTPLTIYARQDGHCTLHRASGLRTYSYEAREDNNDEPCPRELRRSCRRPGCQSCNTNILSRP